jgi:hypothetical protein
MLNTLGPIVKIALIVLGVVVLLVVIVAGIGYTLPQKHQASREQTFSAAPARIFELITTPAEYPVWRSGVKSVEMLPAENGKTRFKETGSDGAITYVFDEMSPARVRSRIADVSLPFGGQWTYDIEPAGTGTKLRITEDGEVYNPIFRFMSRFVFGHHSSIDKYLADLKRSVER